MNLPDNESDYGDFEIEPEEDAAELTPEALVWQLLLLINPGDEETALRQFGHYREALGESDAEPVWAIKNAIDWTSGFFVDGNDKETFIDSVTELVRRWNLEIDWGGDPADEDFLAHTDIPALMSAAYDRLRQHGYTLWNWNTDGDAYAGWMALRRDDEGMQQLAAVMGVEIRPGSDAF